MCYNEDDYKDYFDDDDLSTRNKDSCWLISWGVIICGIMSLGIYIWLQCQ